MLLNRICLKAIGFVLGSLLIYSCESSIAPTSRRVPEMKGFSYTSFTSNGFEQGASRLALNELKSQTQTDYVALNVFVFQDNELSTSIYPTLKTSSDDDIRSAIFEARANSMKVFLKVNLDVEDGRWRAYITPDNAELWFASYTSTILHYASIASANGVEMFSVGGELITATQPQFESSWRRLIASVRSAYSGKLIYCANWDGIADVNSGVPEFEQIRFWDALDFIGVDAYYPVALTSSETPSIATATSRLQPELNSVHTISTRYNRNVVITETGIQSIQGALLSPWNFSRGGEPGAIRDDNVQTIYYNAIINSFGSQSWCKGIFWWNWESVESSNWSTNYTVRNKPAAVVLKNWYSGFL
ncbi:MAG: glycoside hydrolase TIM-barrel-like domain-containing protein [Ignavibacteria bacterium]|nr:glycoside hydrolase TIM-barrel-like domain-containing protein [Ignavibacteria bacterium]